MINIARLKYRERFNDKCGVFGVYGHHEDVARITYYGLYSLQHRGQEGAGISVSDGKKIKTVRGLGLVPAVFSEKEIVSLKGFSAIGHTRYSTTGSNTCNNVQPIIINSKNNDIAIAHNGNIINCNSLIKTLPKIKFNSGTDTEVIGQVIKNAFGKSWEKKILNSIKLFNGAFSIVALTKTKLIAFRDPLGFRPLVIGKLNGGFVVCSETCALDIVGAKYIRDVKCGEVITIDKTGLTSIGQIKPNRKTFCLFEYVYLARPDSILNRELVHQVRQRSGELLSYEAPVAADLVVAIPDSGTSAAIGYSKASGIPFGEILIKNRYIGRTFIQPEQRIRDMGVRIKFNPLKKIVTGKRIIIVDDSIVRGTTIKKVIQILRSCGAKKIHIRICSPPITNSCYFGVDTPDDGKLIASTMDVAQIQKFIDADSLKYLSLQGLIKAARQKKQTLCGACFTGDYPLPIDKYFQKNILEKTSTQNGLKKIAVLISNTGTGTNLQAIIDSINSKKLKAKIDVVVSDTETAFGLTRAKKNKISTFILNSHDNLLEILTKKYPVDYIALAGWKKIIPDNLIKNFSNKILNIHPGLIPDTVNGKVRNPDKTVGLWNRGKMTDKAIANFLNHKVTYAGSSVHFLSDKFDFGPVIGRCFEKIKSNDNIKTLYGRLKKKENETYVKSLIQLCN